MKASSASSRVKQSLSSTKSFARRNLHVDGSVSGLFDNLENEQLLTADQLAERLNVAVRTVRKWRYEGVFPPECMMKLRHQVRYKWSKVIWWLNTKEECNEHP